MKKLFIFIFWALAGILPAVNISAQTADIYKVIPEPQRAGLQQRLAEFVDASSNRKWDKVFDLVAPHLKTATEEEINTGVVIIRKRDFSKGRLNKGIKKFTPQSSRKHGENFYEIYGCGTFPKKEKWEASLWAFYENGNWYFSDIGIIRTPYINNRFRCQD
jgi:hypothetical protein